MVELSGGTWNIRGLRFDYNNVQDFMNACKVDWLVITETHLMPGTLPLNRDRWLLHSATRPVNTVDGFIRAGRNHGGIGFMARPSIVKRMVITHQHPNASYVVYNLNGMVIIGVYLEPNMDIQTFGETLESIGDYLPEDPTTPAVITGDFNLSLAWDDNGIRDCQRGRALRTFLEHHNLTPALPHDNNYCTTTAQQTTRWLDLCLLNDNAYQSLAQCKHIHQYCAYSDHVPVVCTFNLNDTARPPTITTTATNRRYKLTKLEDPVVGRRHAEMLNGEMQKVQHWLDEQMVYFHRATITPSKQRRQALVNQIAAKIDKAIIHTAETILGAQCPDESTGGRKQRRVQSAKIQRLEGIISKLQSEVVNSQLPTADWRHSAIRRTQKQLHSAMQEQNKTEWKKFAENISNEKIAIYLSTLKRIRRGKQRGVSPDLAQQDLDEIATTYESQMCPCDQADFGIQPRQLRPQEVPAYHDQGLPWNSPAPDDFEDRFSPETVGKLLRNSASGKASGLDNICKELLGATLHPKRRNNRDGTQQVENQTISTIANVFKAIYEIGVPPERWCKALVVPIFKDKGSRTDWSNWRPISLLPYLRKTYESCFKSSIVLNGFHPLQGGFCPSKSTLDQVATLDQAIHILKRNRKTRFIAFLDIWAAFDSVDRNKLWDICIQRGMCRRDIQFLSLLQEGNESYVVGRNKTSRPFKARAGVQQGGTISPLLYNCLIDGLCEQLDAAGLGVHTSQRCHIPGGLFADDVFIITDTAAKLQQSLDICERYSQQFAFRWKPSKSFVVASKHDQPFTIYGNQLEFVKTFKYLGIPIGVDGIEVEDLIFQNMKKAQAASRFMSAIGVNAAGFAPYRNALAWKSFVRPCYEYGLCLIQPSPSQLQRLDQSMNASLKKAIGGYSSSSSAVIQELCLVDPADVRVSYLQLRQIIRMMNADDGTLVKRWLGDALQDSSSPLRKLMDGNGLFDHVWKKTPMGPELRQLWTEAEMAAVYFGRTEGLPWPARNDGAFQNIPVIDPNAVQEWKDDQKQVRMVRAIQEGNNILWRDLPPITRANNPLKMLQLERKDWRLLLGWLTGFFPSHRRNQVCHVCGDFDIVNSSDSLREHVANCAQRLAGFPVLPHILKHEVDRLCTDQVRLRRSSNDSITLAFWLIVLKKTYTSDCIEVQNLCTALNMVHDQVLQRNFRPP